MFLCMVYNKSMDTMKLSTKRRKFVEAYSILANGKQAAIEAGYARKQADSQASRLLRDENVKRYLHSLLEASTTQTVMKKKEVLVNLSNIARANLKDLTRWNSEEVKVIDSSILDKKSTAGIQAISSSNNGVHIKLVDRFTALSRLLSHYEKMDELIGSNENNDEAIHKRLLERMEKPFGKGEIPWPSLRGEK